MLHVTTQPAHDGRHHIYLSANGVVTRAKAIGDAGGNQQHRHVEAQQVQIGQLTAGAEAVIANHHKQGVLVPGLVTHLIEETAQAQSE